MVFSRSSRRARKVGASIFILIDVAMKEVDEDMEETKDQIKE